MIRRTFTTMTALAMMVGASNALQAQWLVGGNGFGGVPPVNRVLGTTNTGNGVDIRTANISRLIVQPGGNLDVLSPLVTFTSPTINFAANSLSLTGTSINLTAPAGTSYSVNGPNLWDFNNTVVNINGSGGLAVNSTLLNLNAGAVLALNSSSFTSDAASSVTVNGSPTTINSATVNFNNSTANFNSSNVNVNGPTFAVASTSTFVSNAPIQAINGVGAGGGVPANPLDVNGGAVIGASYYGTTAPTNGLFVEGELGVGYTANPGSYKAYVNGTFYAAGGVFGSDVRWKKNITPINGALNKVLNMKGVTYEFRHDEFPQLSFPQGVQVGFIAQEMEKTVPEVVVTNNDGFKVMAYQNLTAVLAEAMKEEHAIVERQRAELEALRADVVRLEGMVRALLQGAGSSDLGDAGGTLGD